MADRNHVAMLERGVEAWNQWHRKQLSLVWGGYIADLSGANLFGRDLSNAILKKVDLRGARLKMVDLRGADLSGARLDEADFERATLGGTSFCDVDLSKAKALESVRHLSPSTIGIDTLYKSGGAISREFLRDAGVPEGLISYIPSLIGTGVDFYSLFISYSMHDQEFAERIHADLREKRVRCWFAGHDVKSGEKLHEQIDQAIRVHDKLLLILSQHSMHSEWVKTEISKARRREVHEERQVLFPIRLCTFEELRDWECFDADTGKDSAREIREYFIPDFSNWKDHDTYKSAFDRLLRDLQEKSKSTA